MRILIASLTFPPFKDGISEASSSMAKGFLQQGWEVDILTQPANESRTNFQWNNTYVYEWRMSQASGIMVRTPEESIDLRLFLLNGGWDVIVFHAYDTILYTALPLLHEIASHKILVSHGYPALQWAPVMKFPFGLGRVSRGFLSSLSMPFWLRRLDRVVYLSEKKDWNAFYDHLLASISGYKGVRVIPNGVCPNPGSTDPADFRKRHGIPSEAIVLLCVANYSRRKDQGFAARAFRAAALPDAILIFIGSEFNSYSNQFMAQDQPFINKPGHGRVIWLEKQSRDETLNAFSACDIFVLSADHEAQPIALLEAMRVGKPWIARNAGCINLMEGGITVNRVPQMACAMRLMHDNQSLRDDLGKKGLHAASNRYTLEAYQQRYCDLIKEVVKKSEN